MRTARVLGVCVLALASACGDGGAGVAPIGGDGNPAGDGDAPGDGDGDGGGSTVGPVIEVMSPKAAKDPVADDVVVGSEVDVICKVTQRQGGAAVDPAKVTADVFVGDEDKPVVSQAASASGVDTFKATISTAAVPGGAIRIGCSATDLATNPQIATVLNKTFFDSGPVIEFSTLKDGSVVPLGEDDSPDVTIQFSVKPLALAKGDSESAVASVVLDIDGQEVEAKLDTKTKTYVYPLDFEAHYSGVPVMGTGITVKAKNKRAPKAAEATSKVGLTVDGNGPVITVVSPVGKSGLAPIVGSQVDVLLKIVDQESSVTKDPGKLFATIGYQGEDVKYPLEFKGGDSYQFTFFAAQFEDTANVTANIHVEDIAGNINTLAHTMRFDTVPPWLTIVPSRIRGFKPNADTSKPGECSASFRPTGNSPQDGQIVPIETRIRAMILEQATDIEGATERWYAGVDDTTTKLFALEANGDPMLINKVEDDDNYCDTIGAGREIALEPIKPAGGVVGTTVDDGEEPPLDSCIPKPLLVTKTLCENTSDLDLVHGQYHEETEPALYATKVSDSGVGCTGTSIDLQAKAGWICLVAVATDNAGNFGFSAPIRVCRKAKASDCDPDKSVGDIIDVPPEFTCTDGCVLPPFVTESRQPFSPYFGY